ncbi:hypothetical protein [Undibacterium sp. TS12]|uniref:hypothetical protein n=1 Tax=Undibacterium sp. TS12 TaxID=2908202 RepID=UPI001F4C59A4|nr:hypothetical protein [Undibacterium sp. TS12]MCH8620536.1 hypothetical protein [Undibacterium sp. TS12]
MTDVMEMPVLPTRISIRNYATQFELHRLYTVRDPVSTQSTIKNTACDPAPKILSTGAAPSVVFVPENAIERIFSLQPVMQCHLQIGLVVAIRKSQRRIVAASVLDHVFGYAIGFHMVRAEEPDAHCASMVDNTANTHTWSGRLLPRRNSTQRPLPKHWHSALIVKQHSSAARRSHRQDCERGVCASVAAIHGGVR